MLNITTRISLSKTAKKTLKKFHVKNDWVLLSDSWDKINIKVKNELSKKLLFNQQCKCAYCERDLYEQVPQIDHFASKGLYPAFAFITTNLFYSCSFCNSPKRKGQNPTIDEYHLYYNNCRFSIVHPYFFNPDDEIYYTDDDKIILDIERCTTIGRDTIDFFGLDDIFYTRIRAQNLRLKDYPLPFSDKTLINKIVAYKSK